MSTETITTIIKMIETLPGDKQEKVAEHMREYIADLEDEIRWDILFKDTQLELSSIAKGIRKETTEGKTENFDYRKL